VFTKVTTISTRLCESRQPGAAASRSWAAARVSSGLAGGVKSACPKSKPPEIEANTVPERWACGGWPLRLRLRHHKQLNYLKRNSCVICITVVCNILRRTRTNHDPPMWHTDTCDPPDTNRDGTGLHMYENQAALLLSPVLVLVSSSKCKPSVSIRRRITSSQNVWITAVASESNGVCCMLTMKSSPTWRLPPP
jgi:hypothetical protein